MSISLIPESLYVKNEDSNIAKVYSLFDEQMKEVNQATQSLFLLFDIQNQEGTQLDKIGENLNTTRQNLPDERYRSLLLLAFYINSGRNTKDDIISILQYIFDEKFIELRELHPASKDEPWFNNEYKRYLDGSIYLDGELFLSEDILEPLYFEVIVKDLTPAEVSLINFIINRIKPAGVKYRLKEVA